MTTIRTTKYCIMTQDLKSVEVGCARDYYFLPIDELAASGTKINLFATYNKAKSSFGRSWSNVSWNEDKKRFEGKGGHFVIRKVNIAYEIE